MVIYPDILEVSKQGESFQDERGHFLPTDATWQKLGICRAEKDAHGASEVNNASVQPHSYTIYMPKGSIMPRQGEQIRITRRRDGVEVDKITLQCIEAEIGFLHNRVWAR